MNFSYRSIATTGLPVRIRQAFSSKAALFSIVIIGVLGALTLVFVWMAKPEDTTSSTFRSTPDYQTLLPANKTIDQLGGWQRVSPPEAAPAYAYTDTIDSVRVSVSQQPLPDNFMENTQERIKDLAQGFNATTELTISGGDKLYIGTSARGPQSAIIIKNGLLILIKSEEKISDAAWKQYAASLE